MVGKTRLYQHTGSPLIRGMSRRRTGRGRWLWVLLVVAIVAGAGTYLYLTYVR